MAGDKHGGFLKLEKSQAAVAAEQAERAETKAGASRALMQIVCAFTSQPCF